MARTMRDRELHVQICRFELPAEQSANAQASPASPLGIILSPEKLIHSPRLRIYCQMLARGGVRFPGTDASVTEEKISEDAAFGKNTFGENLENMSVESSRVATLRLVYTLHVYSPYSPRARYS